MGLYRDEKQPCVPLARGRHSLSNHSKTQKLKQQKKTKRKSITEIGDRPQTVNQNKEVDSKETKRDIMSENKTNRGKDTKRRKSRTKHIKHAEKAADKQIELPKSKISEEKKKATEKEPKERYKEFIKNEPEIKSADKNRSSKSGTEKKKENIQWHERRTKVLHKDQNQIINRTTENENSELLSMIDKQESENSEHEWSDEESIQLVFSGKNLYDEELHYGDNTAPHYRSHEKLYQYYNGNAKRKRLKELAEIYAPYRVVLIPGDNPGVRWVTTLGLFFTTILFFAAWGSALYYILTPAVNGTDIPETDFGKMFIR